jgi:hypothetical protein
MKYNRDHCKVTTLTGAEHWQKLMKMLAQKNGSGKNFLNNRIQTK